MKKQITLLLAFFLFFSIVNVQAQEKKTRSEVDNRIDNMGYWRKMAAKGLVPVAPNVKPEKAIYTGSFLNSLGAKSEDSPDIPLNDSEATESENSVFVNPTDNQKVLNSNNSTSWTGTSYGVLYGANYFLSDDMAQTWGGSVEGAGGNNSGDPAALISLTGRHFVGFIHSSGGQGVSYSDNGTTWTSVLAAPNPGDMLDKNHLWIDNSPTSPYVGYVYDAWTPFGGSNDTEIEIVRSSNAGVSYSAPINLSAAVNAGSHNQGVNIQTGPEGNVYVAWAIYDDWVGKGYEEAIGFAKSTNGGTSYTAGTRIIGSLKGIRGGITKDQRVNSFPSMTTDISGGTYDGNIYIVWANYGTPGVNTGTNVSIYMIKSENQGASWSTPIRVNQGPNTAGKASYFPWITCDPETGILSVIYFDDRNVSSSQVEAYVSNSFDGGDTWEDMKVSDVAFTPAPIPGLADGYMGDYLGIAARGGYVYPVWGDNRNGFLQTWCSPYQTNTRIRPVDLQIALTEETGATVLTWNYTEVKTLQNFVVYRDGVQLGTTTETTYSETLPAYGKYKYSVTAMHDDGESVPVSGNIQWGNPKIAVTPTSLSAVLPTNQSTVKQLTIQNIGELELTYALATEITSKNGKNPKAYCTASSSTEDEYISNVTFGTINNSTGWTSYSDFTAQSTDVNAGESYPISIAIGTSYSADYGAVWVDWNQDEDFVDAGENMPLTVSSGDGPYTGNLLIPFDALAGSTRMRVRLNYSSIPTPCGTTTYGETEDYTLNVNSWLKTSIKEGTVNPGETAIIDVTFNSDGLAVGVYTANITISSNDTEASAIVVPVSLTVSDVFSAFPYASDATICSASTTQLFANAASGSGSYTYSWTSVPEGFTSDIADPMVTPSETTVYTVEVSDGVDIVTESVTVTIIEAPNTPTVPAGPVSPANNSISNYTVSAVSGASSYQWQLLPVEAGIVTGSTTTGSVDWSNTFSGPATISVKAINECEESAFSTELEVNVTQFVGVENFNNIKFNFYPNPTKGSVIYTLQSETTGTLKLSITNSYGQIVYIENINAVSNAQSEINLEKFPNGIYIINLQGENTNLTRRIILQK